MHLAMVDEADGNENFFWENQQWLISDISDADISIDVLIGAVAGGDEDKGKKVLDLSTSNSPNILLGGGVAVPMEATLGKKRSAIDGGGGSGSGSGGGGGESDHEMHLWTERERRKKMRNMFSSLQALIPHLSPKADKSTIVDEAVSYIKSLQQTLKQLQNQKLERLHGNMNFVGPSRLSQQKLALMDTRESFMADQGSSSSMATVNATNPFPSFSNIPRFPTTMAFETWFSPNVVLKICGENAHISVCSLKKPGMLSMICDILDKNKLEVVSAHVFADNFRNMYMIQMRGNSTDYQLLEGFLVGEAFKKAAVDIMLWITKS